MITTRLIATDVTMMLALMERLLFLCATLTTRLRGFDVSGRDLYPPDTIFFRFVSEQVQKQGRGGTQYLPIQMALVTTAMGRDGVHVQFLGGYNSQHGHKQRRVLEAAAVAAYHAQMEWPVVQLLVGDDAPQWKWLTEALALCWIHEGRHYKKLIPYVDHHRKVLEEFLGKYWAYSDQRLVYRAHPTADEKARRASEFDKLFATVTDYAALEERIAKTRAKKESLLLVLDHPEIPLHNNESELGARWVVRQRDVSFGTRSAEGTRARDTFLTLVATAKKLGVSFYQYVYDRISGAHQMPSLADVIREKAKQLNLRASW